METILSENLDAAAKNPLIRGKDIMGTAARLGIQIKPGPEFGKIIKTIEGSRDEGKISTREEALAELEKLMRK